jgi:hypothetical protein
MTYSSNHNAMIRPRSKEAVEYARKLSDLRWIKKRNKIVSRDGHKCRLCSSTDNLQVHHLSYVGEPWDAPDDQLRTLCYDCHRLVEVYFKGSHYYLGIKKVEKHTFWDGFNDYKVTFIAFTDQLIVLETESLKAATIYTNPDYKSALIKFLSV